MSHDEIGNITALTTCGACGCETADHNMVSVNAHVRRLESAISELECYFTSTNNVPVSQATIKTSDFMRICGK